MTPQQQFIRCQRELGMAVEEIFRWMIKYSDYDDLDELHRKTEKTVSDICSEEIADSFYIALQDEIESRRARTAL